MKNMLWMAVLSTLMFACSSGNEDIPAGDSKALVFDLAAVNEASEGLVSRSRPLYGQDALQEVEDVKIYVYQQSGADYVYLKTFSDITWPKGTSFQRYTLTEPNELPQGNYQFLLVGKEATTNYTMPVPTGSSKIEDLTASISAPGQESEIFAGTKIVNVTDEGARVSIEMTRRVCGILGYFKNVPANLNGKTVKYLRLTVSNTDNTVGLSTGNGSAPVGSSYNIIDVDLLATQAVNGEVFVGNDLSAQGVAKVANSQLFGKFLLPIKSVTMTLGLYDNTNALIKSWQVEDNGNTILNLDANHFYAMGRKVSQSNTDGGTPEPGDDDAPVDLLTDQVIAITINANWSVIHNLTIQ